MSLTPRVDASSLATLVDPYPVYDDIRAAGRALRGGIGQWIVSHYHDVSALLRSNKLSNEFPEAYRRQLHGSGPAAELLGRVMLHRDPPAHRELRRAIGFAFEKPKIPPLAQRASELAASLLAERAGRSFDLVEDFAVPLPILMICEILGIPAAMGKVLRPHVVALSRAFRLQLSSADVHAADQAVTFLRQFVRESSASSVKDHVLSAAHGGAHELATHDLLDNIVFLLFASFETTSSLIATGSALLSEREELARRLRASPHLLAAFIEEVLRFDAPIQSRARYTHEPVTIGERIIRPGRVVVLLIGAANRDPAVFERPGDFILERHPNTHLSFGAGAHFCLGAALARAEAIAAFSMLLRNFSAIEPLAAPVRDTSSVFRGYGSIAVELREPGA